MFSRRTFVLVLILALVGWFVYQRYFTPITNHDPVGTHIIALGDSLTYPYGVAPTQCYVGLLEKEFGVKMINAGVPGDTTGQALGRFDRDVIQKDPKVVIVALGGNDLLRRLPREKTEENLDYMVKRVLDEGAAVVLVGVEGPLGAGGLGKVIKRLGKKHNVAYVPNVMRGILGNPRLMLSGEQVHPNPEGHKIIADRLAKVLRRELPKVFK